MNDPISSLPILEVVSVKGILRIGNQPDIILNQRSILVQNKEGVITHLDLDAELGRHRNLDRYEVGVEDELIIAERDGRKRIFLCVG